MTLGPLVDSVGGVPVLHALLTTLLTLSVMGAGLHQALFLCRTEQLLHTRCCCIGKTTDPIGAPELRRAPCCDGATLSGAMAPASTSAAALVHVPPPVLIEHRAASEPTRVADAWALAVDARGTPATPRATGPPHRIKHCSLPL